MAMTGSSDSTRAGRPLPDPLPLGLFALLLALVLVIPIGVRLRAWPDGATERAALFSQGVPASGSDSYYWFRIARELRDRGPDLGAIDPLRAWPEGLPRGPVPAYSWLIARASRAFDGDVYRAGMAANVALSSVFVVPLALFGRRLGLSLAGLLGGFVGALGRAYLPRSSIHRVDTDGGTLFFLCLLALGLAGLRADAPRRRNLLVAAASGLALAAFCRWYGQPGFWLVWVGTLALHLAAGGFARRDALAIGLLFTLLADPRHALPGLAGLAHFLAYYVLPGSDAPPGPLDYANVTRDIAELLPLPPMATLAGVVARPEAAAIGLLGFAAFAVVRWRSAIPLLPIALLGLYALVGPQRFGMYLAPLVGFGLGWLVHAAVGLLARARALRPRAAAAVAGLAACALAALLFPLTGASLEPKPSVPLRLVAGLQRMAARGETGDAILASWGRGYLIADVARTATLSDGEAPDPLVHYLFARAITSDSPGALARIAALLASTGRSALHAAIDGASDPQAAIDALIARDARPRGEIVLLLTGLDLVPFPGFFRTGRWDFARGEGPEDGYVPHRCTSIARRGLRCLDADGGGFDLDRATGRVSGGRWLRRVVEIDGSGHVRETRHAPGAEFSLQLVRDGETGSYTGYVLSEQVFASNFNQLFFLGRFDPEVFEEVERDLPVLRAYRIRTAGRSN